MARARNRKGRFTKRRGSKHRKHRRSRRSVAIVRVNAGSPARRHKRRRHHSGGGGSMIPGVPMSQVYDAAGAAAYGWLEAQVRSSDDSTVKQWLQKLPTPIASLGFSGHMVLFAYVIAKYGPAEVRKYARHLFNGTLDVFAYQVAAQGGLFKAGGDMFKISGLTSHAGLAEHYADVEDAQLAGIPFDPAVHNAGAHT